MHMLQTEQEQLKQENKAFRYLYGFGILFVVLSHCDGGGFEMLSNWMHFGAFHLAIFVFGSGYFLAGRTVTKPVAFVWKKVKSCWYRSGSGMRFTGCFYLFYIKSDLHMMRL